MGLDMYINTRPKNYETKIRKDEDGYEYRDDGSEEFAYFRKHSDLHGYFEQLYIDRGGTEEFNCVELPLSKEDIITLRDLIDKEIKGEKVFTEARGFFWGKTRPDEWLYTFNILGQLLEEVDFETTEVYYDSWW